MELAHEYITASYFSLLIQLAVDRNVTRKSREKKEKKKNDIY